MLENTEPLEQISKLLKAAARKNFEVAEANFAIGRLISQMCGEHGEPAVTEVASFLNGRGISVSAGFLFDALRVFRSLKNEGTLRKIKEKLHGNLRWGFLVYNCTKAPEGGTEEAEIFWDRKLSQIESAMEDMAKLSETLDALPPSIREQVEGLLHATHELSPTQENETREAFDGNYRIGHMADLQVDDEFTVAGRIVIDPQTGMNERLLDIHNCISHAVEVLIDRGCRACLIAGDLTETPHPSPNVERYLLKNLTRLAEHMPVFVEPGNHGLSKNPKDSTALEFLKGRKNIFVVEEPTVFYQEGVNVSMRPSENWPQKDCAKIFVLPFPSKAIVNGSASGKTIEELNKMVSDRLRLYLHSFRAEIDPSVPNILMAHITVAGAKGTENAEMLKYDPVLYPEDLSGFDYVALGHIHEFQNIGESIFYSGSIDRMDFNEEGQPKGFLMVTFEGKSAHTEFLETPARKFMTIGADFFEQDGWRSLVEAKTIYRIKGDVTKEQYEELKPLLKDFPVPLLNKLTVRRDIRIRDEKMTEELKEYEAVERYLASQGIDPDLLNACIEMHNTLLEDKEEVDNGPSLFAAA
jgi:exonuclease SbcD